MNTIIILVAIVAIVLMAVMGFFVGKKSTGISECIEKRKQLESEVEKLKLSVEEKEKALACTNDLVRQLTSERDVQRTKAENAEQRLQEECQRAERVRKEDALRYEAQILEKETTYKRQIEEKNKEQAKLMNDWKVAYEAQMETLRQMNREQVESQAKLIREQMKATSEQVLKDREEELRIKNREQVSLIIDPLHQSLKEMRTALERNKEQQNEALTRLDATIQANMQKSMALGETADRLTRALTGEVKVQGNFGELKLKQLLEGMELHEGEQFDTQTTLRDHYGKALKDDEERGLIPDFILHFPNNRHVVVDAKMSLTDYERYMNADTPEERTACLKAHLLSVRNQVARLARKDYSRYLPAGYNKLNFVIMYVPVEGALNLALLNDATLWKEAYDQGVMVLGPQSMYMNLRVLEMMWTQVRQLQNQQEMMDAANIIIERVQDFGTRFMDVEASMNDTLRKMTSLKTTTANDGRSIITAARNLLKAGAKENKKKKSVTDMEGTVFLDGEKSKDNTQLENL